MQQSSAQALAAAASQREGGPGTNAAPKAKEVREGAEQGQAAREDAGQASSGLGSGARIAAEQESGGTAAGEASDRAEEHERTSRLISEGVCVSTPGEQGAPRTHGAGEGSLCLHETMFRSWEMQ